MSTAFRQRAASALTHPVTVTALATLVLNDLVLKRLWPGEWVTGKLSDLAWMVFAPPLLAYLLSITVLRRNHPRAERWAAAAAYVGLPLLYAAFNTFASVHDVILRGLSLVGGGTPRSPLDVTDSLVIPFAIAIAFWVWNRTPVGAEAMRARLALLTSAVAMIASVATSYPEPHLGIVDVESDESGAIVAVSDTGDYLKLVFQSVDGGLTWSAGESSRVLTWTEESAQLRGAVRNLSVDTPAGSYFIEGTDIIRRDRKSGSEVVYSAAYLTEKGNLALQEITTTDIENRIATRGPYDIAYDPRSGNIVLAMGLQGVVVGMSDGQWTRINVGRYEPTNFSFVDRILPLQDWRFAVTALAIAVSFTALALGFGLRRPTTETPGESFMRMEIIILASLAVMAAIAIPVFGWVGLLFSLVLLLGLPLVFLPTSRWTIFLATLSATAAILSVLAFASYDQTPADASLQPFSLPLAGFALVAGLGAATASRPILREVRAAAVALAGIFMLTGLLSVLWTLQGLGFWFAHLSTVVLASLIVVALSAYLARTGQDLHRLH